jgi:hypothetical protein
MVEEPMAVEAVGEEVEVVVVAANLKEGVVTVADMGLAEEKVWDTDEVEVEVEAKVVAAAVPEAAMAQAVVMGLEGVLAAEEAVVVGRAVETDRVMVREVDPDMDLVVAMVRMAVEVGVEAVEVEDEVGPGMDPTLVTDMVEASERDELTSQDVNNITAKPESCKKST